VLFYSHELFSVRLSCVPSPVATALSALFRLDTPVRRQRECDEFVSLRLYLICLSVCRTLSDYVCGRTQRATAPHSTSIIRQVRVRPCVTASDDVIMTSLRARLDLQLGLSVQFVSCVLWTGVYGDWRFNFWFCHFYCGCRFTFVI